jgi:hypothetical protein
MDKIEKIQAKIVRMLDDICEADGFVQKKDEPRYDALTEVLDFVDTLEEEPDESLEEAARLYAIPHYMKDIDVNHIEEYPYDTGLEAAFIAGAQWQEERNEETIKTAEDHAFLAGADWQKEQDLTEASQSKSPLSVAYTNRCFENGKQVMKEQMLKDAVDGVVENWNSEPYPEITIPLNPEEFTAGDKVKLIIVKED